MSKIVELSKRVYKKVVYITKLIVTTPNYVWIIVLQTISGFFSFLGLPMLIPVLEYMKDGGVSSSDNVYLNLIQKGLNIFGLVPNFYNTLVIASFLILSGQLLIFVSRIIAVNAQVRLAEKYRRDIVESYSSSTWAWLTDNKSGEINYSVIQEATLASVAHLNAQRVLMNAIQMAVFLLIAVRLSLLATIWAVGVYFVLGVANLLNSRHVLHLAEKYNNEFKKLSNEMVGFQQNKKFFKVSLLSKKMGEGINVFLKKLTSLADSQNMRIELQHTWNMMITSMFLMGLIFFHKSLSLDYATLLLMSLVFFKLAPQFVTLSGSYLALDGNIPMHESIMRKLEDLSRNVEQNGVIPFAKGTNIKFKNVSFSYNPKVKVLENIDFEIKTKTTTAFIGGSGAGKTTILDLILRLLDPNEGTIFYGSIPHHEIDKESFRSKVAYISQEQTLLDGTLRENLTIGKENADLSQINEICAKVHLDTFLKHLPEGVDTEIGENGVKLSGGQRQRVVIARALFTSPEILILDEATSELDLESERMVQETIKDLSKELTIIIVAHRLSTVKDADVINVLEKGKICESGSYQELLFQKGRLYYLDSLQTRSKE